MNTFADLCFTTYFIHHKLTTNQFSFVNATKSILSMPSYIAIFKQFYIVTSGYGAAGYLSSTEILKETESWWQTAANMAHGYMPRYGLRGISLPNGQFFVTGNGFYATMHYTGCFYQLSPINRL